MFCIFYSAKMCNVAFRIDRPNILQKVQRNGAYQWPIKLKTKPNKASKWRGKAFQKQADLSVGGRREAARGIDCPPSSPLCATKPSHILGGKLSPNLPTFKLSLYIVIKLPFWNALNANNWLPSQSLLACDQAQSHLERQVVTKPSHLQIIIIYCH